MQHSWRSNQWTEIDPNSFNIYHLCETTIAEPAILHGPTQALQVSARDSFQIEVMALAANVRARLLDVDASMTISLAKKFLDKLDRGVRATQQWSKTIRSPDYEASQGYKEHSSR